MLRVHSARRREYTSRLRASRPVELALVLRVDRGVEWRELAASLHHDDLDDAALGREAARLRKRYQLAIERLRALARERGLLPKDD